MKTTRTTQLLRRQGRVRAKVRGTAARPRLTVFRSNTSISAQIIDDSKGTTLVAATSHELSKGKKSKSAAAEEVGALIAKKAGEKGVKAVVFDRGSYLYHGRVKALAEAARKAGLSF